MKQIALLFFSIFLMNTATAQYGALGLKGGLTVGIQNWNNQSREPLLAPNVSFVYEKINSDRFSLLLDLGYHVKGSAIRTQYVDLQGNLNRFTARDKFSNLSLMAGAKSVLNTSFAGGDIYYLLGIRLEYTVDDSIQTAANFSRYVQPINYGVTFGGGLQLPLGERMQMFFELQISPDFSQQIFAPPGNYIATYNGSTVNVQLSEQKVVNTVIELTVGFKFLRY